ncbi:hypothetical protein KM295_02335 [Natronomonas sp. F2-12]|uniref:Uncharacterized protein n=1 Tax=Natronomonas aquatica TaxID=2841590 RepID=A0A9R1CR88_9EURY|nr:hypothetical protein [Natronomonas aquatica]MCQ4332343.1 hypothetical protein [Natronomonas aquatica]
MTVILVTTVVVVSLLAPVTAPITVAQESSGSEPETADEYFGTLRGMSDLAIYDEYGELETLHTQSLAAVQVGDFSDEQANELDAVIATIRSFETAQTQFENGEYEAGFETATEIESTISDLRSHDESLAALSRLALTRYYERLGDELASEAEATDHTPTEIDLREMAASAYQGANEPEQAAEFTRQVEQLEAELSADREAMNESAAAMDSFTDACTGCESSTAALGSHNVGVIQQYGTALQVAPMLADATQRAQRHGLEDRQSALQQRRDTARAMRTSLAVASGTILLGYGLVIALVVSLIASRLFAWQRAFEAANLDSVIVMGDTDV